MEYRDIDVNKITLYQLIRKEPVWAKSRIIHLENQLKERKTRLSLLYEIIRAHCPWPIGDETRAGTAYICEWFDDDNCAL